MFAETAIALREAFTLIGMPGVDVYEGVGFGNAPWAERSVDDMGTDRLEFDTKHVYAARRVRSVSNGAADISVDDRTLFCGLWQLRFRCGTLRRVTLNIGEVPG